MAAFGPGATMSRQTNTRVWPERMGPQIQLAYIPKALVPTEFKISQGPCGSGVLTNTVNFIIREVHHETQSAKMETQGIVSPAVAP